MRSNHFFLCLIIFLFVCVGCKKNIDTSVVKDESEKFIKHSCYVTTVINKEYCQYFHKIDGIGFLQDSATYLSYSIIGKKEIEGTSYFDTSKIDAICKIYTNDTISLKFDSLKNTIDYREDIVIGDISYGTIREIFPVSIEINNDTSTLKGQFTHSYNEFVKNIAMKMTEKFYLSIINDEYQKLGYDSTQFKIGDIECVVNLPSFNIKINEDTCVLMATDSSILSIEVPVFIKSEKI